MTHDHSFFFFNLQEANKIQTLKIFKAAGERNKRWEENGRSGVWRDPSIGPNGLQQRLTCRLCVLPRSCRLSHFHGPSETVVGKLQIAYCQHCHVSYFHSLTTYLPSTFCEAGPVLRGQDTESLPPRFQNLVRNRDSNQAPTIQCGQIAQVPECPAGH